MAAQKTLTEVLFKNNPNVFILTRFTNTEETVAELYCVLNDTKYTVVEHNDSMLVYPKRQVNNVTS